MDFKGKEKPRRLGIYFFYDKDGVVDPYNIALLDGIRAHISELLVVCNGKLTKEGRASFSACADQVFVRGNEGFDVWAYKEGLESYGWKKLQDDFDEIILFNFTMFGPIYPFEEMFTAMDAQNLDFWGITVHNGASFDPWGKTDLGYLPVHIQSHFIAVRSTMFNSWEFHHYWDNMCEITCYEEAVSFHEAIFTKHFADKGFKWNAYVEADDIGKDATLYPLMICPLELVKNRRCPIVKRKTFFLGMEDYIGETMGENTYELFEYIKKETDFDENLILQNLLRSSNQYDIKNCLQLNYVLPSNISWQLPDNTRKQVALFLHLYYPECIQDMLRYVRSMPEYADVYVTTDSVEKKEKIQAEFSLLSCNKLHIEVIPSQGRDVSALLVALAKYAEQYDYICFAHDKKSENIKPYVAEESFAYLCFESLLKSRQYVENIIATFDENPRLGLLCPPPPYHSKFYSIIGKEWGSNFSYCRKLAKKIGLTVDLDPRKPPIAPLGREFWFRSAALQPLLGHGFTYEDFPDRQHANSSSRNRENIIHSIERLYPFVVQNQGFYPAWVMPESIAAMEITMLNYYQRTMGDALKPLQITHGSAFAQQRVLAEYGAEINRLHAVETSYDQVINSITWKMTGWIRRFFDLFRAKPDKEESDKIVEKKTHK